MVSVIKLKQKQTFAFLKSFNVILTLHIVEFFLRNFINTITALQHKTYSIISQNETITSYHAHKQKV